ncbi:exopolyphosphatase/guanosine-5'-triphosphate,3'-diphosphate pyrophosphatase [Rathayibacter sp. PhB151]|uniref:Ppx/GppA phosphatase family protein n=1 Tax=Rathayibacter sp. PhB151 TaxID=2485189 RepID=UPI0010626C90|nr:Ppx/GppA family phosphatase [Rathayibacter sp. PhB151]TDX79286.1 exopolyphosphatase/guanosine-5'-triphosphate,3'-diphosphate pyrophosphatase [Rathayibacter sp. PhB151]
MRLGVLDIGSNTVHLLLVDAHPGARPVPYRSHKRSLALVAYLDAAGDITEEGQRELISFVAEAHEVARRHRAEDLLAFATSAIREAGNGAAVLERVRTETGVHLQELGGEAEASATFLAVRRWFGWGAGSILDLDIGGGSFELSMGVDEVPELAVSVPLGAGRVTRDLLDGDPASATSVKAARRHAREVLAEPVRAFLSLGTPDLVAGTSKTFRSLARITGAAPSAAGPLARRELHLVDLRLWSSRLAAISAADRSALPGVSALRAPQLLAGALVAEAAMEALHVETLVICPWATREGLIIRRFELLDAQLQREEPQLSVML